MSGVFISYRRNDSAWFARSLFDALRAAFPSHAIFIDVEGIDAGLDFVDVINERLSSCEALLTIIGRRWLEESAPDGSRRIDDPNDNVRAEIEAALQRKIRVIPVLVDGAQMPSQKDLPESLASLGRRNGLEITHARFSSDTTRLVEVLSSVLASEPSRAKPRAAAEPRKAAKPRGAAEQRNANEPRAASESRGGAAPRKPADRAPAPWRWVAAAGAVLVPVVALSAIFVARVWLPPAPSEKVVSMLSPIAQADPSVPTTGRSSWPPPPARAQPAPEASVPYILPNTFEATTETPAAAPAVVASIEPVQHPPTGADPTAFTGLPKIDVVDKVDLDTDRASARLRIDANQLVARRAECETFTVHAEFGSYALVGSGPVERRPAAKDGSAKGCFFRTDWKDQQSGAIADNVQEMRPRVLNQTLHLLCPVAYGDLVKNCKAY